MKTYFRVKSFERKNNWQNLGIVYNMNTGYKSKEKSFSTNNNVKLSHQLIIKNLNLKVNHHTGGKWFIHGPKREVRCKLSNPVFFESIVRGQNHCSEVDMCRGSVTHINTLRPRQNGRHFADDIFKCIFLNENVWILIRISLKLVPKGPINNIPALAQIMAPAKRQAIIWNIDCLFTDAYMRHSASMS